MPNTEEYTGIVRGLDKAIQNFYAIRNAKAQERARQSKADTENKIQKLKIKQMEDELDPDNLELAQESLKAKIAADETAAKMNTVTLKKAERKARTEIENQKNLIMMRNIYLTKLARGEPLDLQTGMKIDFGDITLTGPGKPSDTQLYRNDLNAAKSGNITWDELKQKYPEPSKQEDIEKVRRSTLPKLKRSPSFRTGRGLAALISKDVANLDAKTVKVIEQIENQEDLDELLERKEEAEIKGVDVDAVLEYFNKAE